MYEDLNQKISQFLDKELDYKESLNLLKKLQAQPEARNKLNCYETISHALKAHVFLTVRPDFFERIRQEIQQEPVYLLPQLKRPQHTQFKRNHRLTAVAVSLAIVAVITTHNINNTADNIKPASIIEVAQQRTPEPVSQKNEAEPSAINSQINDYLQAHNSSVYTNGEATFHPYARVTAYSRK
ncbi:conserved hypothetical protein [Candidatus Methylobacter favarea]|uniref:Anti sigma-E protein RseA N-terminal domain-containing protein n=1 Tax=Candidatus Methylobacter favarea TaxID=2707345 RepID=A0A8S0XKU3_9GAMM|nr:sigma-E factor negative regulatory protein [Candidatus Methylobacter favarea]CAA9892302.1 conserved hypothetical protein [Candidatus Methylobacter favarea]